MESLSPFTLRKALAELALPPREPQPRDKAARRGERVWIVGVLSAVLSAACAFSFWG